MTIRVRRRNLLAEDFAVDTCLFEHDYSIAASTGFGVWEGGWKLVEVCSGPVCIMGLQWGLDDAIDGGSLTTSEY